MRLMWWCYDNVVSEKLNSFFYYHCQEEYACTFWCEHSKTNMIRKNKTDIVLSSDLINGLWWMTFYEHARLVVIGPSTDQFTDTNNLSNKCYCVSSLLLLLLLLLVSIYLLLHIVSCETCKILICGFWHNIRLRFCDSVYQHLASAYQTLMPLLEGFFLLPLSFIWGGWRGGGGVKSSMLLTSMCQ